jgi:general secretion pathway protein E
MDIPQEGAFNAKSLPDDLEGRPLDLRVATFPTARGERAVVRLLYDQAFEAGLDGLGLNAAVVAALREAVEQPQGLILVTGPAGSGKSTTLYALGRHVMKRTPGRSVVSLEDPVEQRIDGMAQIQISPHGELDYVRAMRSLLRQDVEVLLVGEIRDAATAHLVVEASLTGHLIMSTLHSGDPAEAIVRLVEMGIAPYQLVGALRVVCTQRLLRTVCAACGGNGDCKTCMNTGYQGRTACAQLAVIDEGLREAILQHQPAGLLRKMILEWGPDLVADARRLVNEQRTTDAEILRVLGRPS